MTKCDLNDFIYVGHRKWSKQYTAEEYELVDEEIKRQFKTNLGVDAFPIDNEYLGSGKNLLEAIRTYGKQHFHLSVIDIGYNREDLTSKETYWINHFKLQGYSMYNISMSGNMGFDPEEMNEVRQKEYRNRMRKLAEDLDFKSRFGDVSGENNGRYGKPVSDITRLRISRANRGRVQSEEERLMRRKSHMEKCPNIKPPSLKGFVRVTNEEINKFIRPEDLERFLKDNPEWRRGGKKYGKRKKNSE